MDHGGTKAADLFPLIAKVCNFLRFLLCFQVAEKICSKSVTQFFDPPPTFFRSSFPRLLVTIGAFARKVQQWGKVKFSCIQSWNLGILEKIGTKF
jgi:hypothetical protein